MKKRSMVALGLSAAMVMTMLAGCGGSTDTASTDTASTDTASTDTASTDEASSEEASADTTSSDGEKVLKFGCQNYGDGLIDPMNQTNAAWNCMRYGISECLFKFDDNMNAEPWLAESVEASDDYKTFVVTLKEGVKFSDGCDMTATKVKESFDRIFEEGPNGSSTPEKYIPYDTVVTADDDANTVTFEFAEPTYNFEGNLAYPCTAVVDVADTTDWNNGTIGTGPYAVESYEDQVKYTMTKNTYYYEEVPYDTVEIIYMGDASAKAMALQAGDVDLVENITNVSDIQTLQDDPDYTVDIASGVRCGFAWMNMNGVLGNETLRKAILTGIDYNTICESNTIGGLYTPGYSVLPSTLDYGYDTLTNPYEYDPDAAKQMLDDAGIVDSDGDGIRELDGENIVLKAVSYENRLLNDFMDAQTLYLTELGIGVEPSYGSSDDQWSSLVAFDYDLNQNNWTTVGSGDPSDYMANWYSKAEANYCGYANDEYDALYEELLETADQDARKDIITQLQQILIDDAAVLVDGYYNSSMIYSKNVGYAHIHTADYYWLTTEIVPA